jgi:uncharacterized protein (DUF3084 family)
LLWGVLGTVVIVFLIKYGVEYYKTKIEYLKQIESERNKRHSELKSVLEGIYAETKKANASRTLLQHVEELKKLYEKSNK